MYAANCEFSAGKPRIGRRLAGAAFLNIDRRTVFQLFKYAVYAFLAFNIWVFFDEEHLAARIEFADGVPILSLRQAYAATIDTAAWWVLLLMFELETFVLEDRRFTPTVTASLHGVRVLCYALIVVAFTGYIQDLGSVYDVAPASAINSLCAITGDGWSYAIDFDEYEAITAANCATFSNASSFWQFGTLPALVDSSGLRDIQGLAWADVINAGVWLLIVLVLEIDVRLQERGQHEGVVLRVSNASKFLLYATLFVVAVYWGIKGDFVDFWDAFLWLVAFFFIEMNVVEWRQESISKS